MDRSDFTTHVVVAVSAFLATLPALISPPQGPKDIYKVIFVLGPIAMVSLAVYGRRREVAARAAHGGQDKAGVRRVGATHSEEGSAKEERSASTSGGASALGSKREGETPGDSTRGVKT